MNPSDSSHSSTYNGNGTHALPMHDSTTSPHESTKGLSTQPFPASKKVYVKGKLPGVNVPMREIQLTPTQLGNGAPSTPNAPTLVYDPSGPYTDAEVHIDVREGLKALRQEWILGRGDVEQLEEVSSEYGRKRATDPSLANLRFTHLRKPLRAKPGRNVTQMHYAKKGIITPEMEFIAIRENQRRRGCSLLKSHGI